MDTKKLIKRSCDGCNVCCEGWLNGTIYGKRMYPGMPCHFKTEKGCGIYKKRPKDPCRDFYCEWLKNTEIPEWFKPNTSKVLLRTLKINEIPYEERDHALYIAYGPYVNPRYALSVIVEHGGSGGTVAAPIAKNIFKLVIDRHDLREKTRLEKFTNT